jgi:G3E family GTPase
VHAVQHVAHRPVELLDWPDDDRRSRLVFITRNLAKARVEPLFAAIAGLGGPEMPPSNEKLTPPA